MPSYTYTLTHIYSGQVHSSDTHQAHSDYTLPSDTLHLTFTFQKKVLFLKKKWSSSVCWMGYQFWTIRCKLLRFHLNMCRFEWLIHPWFPKFWFPRWNRNVCLGDLRGLELFPAVSIFTQIAAIKSSLFTQIVGKIAESWPVIHPGQASTTFDNLLLSVAVKTHTSEFCVFPVDYLVVFLKWIAFSEQEQQ